MPSAYQPIADYLAGYGGDVVRLSFERIEEILDFALPATAHGQTTYWTAKKNPWVRTWTQRGWHARLLRLEAAVVFRRIVAKGER